MTTLANFGFAIEMEVSTNGESFQINGDQQKLILSFPSLRAALRILRSNSVERLTATHPLGHLLHQTLVETQISGRQIATTGREIRSDLLAEFLGLKSTRLNIANLFRALLCPTPSTTVRTRS